MSLGLMLFLVPAVFVVAGVYASVGLGGGTGYLAIMALVGMPPSAMVHTALLLNIVVTGTAQLRFGLAGRMRWPLFLPFLLPAIPCAFLGAMLEAERTVFLAVLAAVLAVAGVAMFGSAAGAAERDGLPKRVVLMMVAVPAGIGIGLLSGFLGVGGGVFLGPLVLFLGWAGPKQVAAMNSALILVLSSVALAAHGMTGGLELALVLPLGVAALVGGLLGATLAERKLSAPTLQRVFAVIVLIAALKACFDAFHG